LAFSLVGCNKPVFLGGEFPLAEQNERPGEIKDFGKLFNTHCRGCHGPNGRDGGAPPLNDPLFLAIVPEAELRQVIANGRKHTLMPAFAHANGGPLTDQQIAVLAGNLHAPDKLKDWTRPEAPRDTPDYLLADALKKGSKPGDAGQGADVYAMNCAGCHGSSDGKSGTHGPVLDPAFLALTSDQALRRIVITGRHDLGMPDYRTRTYKNFVPLTNQDVADVVAFVAARRKAP
jgi:cytochrome c oxidase cbb3-type subunit 3/ubiquinol-cytochrome c reductase cytochrome c subunit